MKRTACFVASLIALTTFGTTARAQSGDGGGLQFRIGGFFPAGDSEFWDVDELAFTAHSSDFNDAIGGASWLAPINNHLEIGFNVDFYDARSRAAYVDFEDEFGFPILHDTRLETMPVTVDLRIHPAGRQALRGSGGRILVRRPSFYVGGGAGMNVWEYEKVGDFIFRDSDGLLVLFVEDVVLPGGGTEPATIYFDRFKDSGVAFEAHVLAGVELPVSPTWSINVEGRYSWSTAKLGGRFAEFGLEDLDLGGVSGFFGATMRF